MSTPLHSIIEAFSDEDQRRIQAKAAVLARDMVQHADSLVAVRAMSAKPAAALPAEPRSNTKAARCPEEGPQADGSGCPNVSTKLKYSDT